MNMNGIKRMWNSVVYSLALLGAAGGASLGMAQVSNGNIASIHSGYNGDNPCKAPGTVIPFTIRLGKAYTAPGPQDNWQLLPKPWVLAMYPSGGLEVVQALYPLRVRMSTGGYATLVSVSQCNTANDYLRGKADFNFEYVVRPGDVGLPLSIAGTAGNESSGNSFAWQNSDWWMVGNTKDTSFTSLSDNQKNDLNWNTAPGAIWRYGSSCYNPPEDKWDIDLSGAGIKIQTVKFTQEMELNVGDRVSYSLSSFAPVTNDVSLYVWSGDTNYFTLFDGSMKGSGSNTVVAISIPSGATVSSSFTILGVKDTGSGTIPLYVSQMNGFQPLVTNSNYYFTAPVTVKPTTPTIRIALPDSGNYEESDLIQHSLNVVLSEPAPSNMTVRLSYDSNLIRLDGAATVSIASGNTSPADSVKFYALDGGTNTVITAVPSEYFTTVRGANVTIANVSPVISVGAIASANTYIAKEFTCLVQDVNADAATMKVTWTWQDGKTTETTGIDSVVTNTFSMPGVYTIYVQARDKNRGTSDTVAITVTVTDLAPQPFVSILPPPSAVLDESGHYNVRETNSAPLSSSVTLSQKYPGDVTVRLRCEYPDPAVANLALSVTDVTIPQGSTNASFSFKVLDGTPKSESSGVKVIPEIISSTGPTPASNIFVSVRSGNIYVLNAAPVIVSPLNGDNTTYANVAINSDQTFTFNIQDVNGDLSGMSLNWDWGDGSDPTVVTDGYIVTPGGVVNSGTVKGKVTHRYTMYPADGYYTAILTVIDKDGVPYAQSTFLVQLMAAPQIAVAPAGLNLTTPRRSEVDESDTPLSIPMQVYLSKAAPAAIKIDLTITSVTGNGRLTFENGTTTKTISFNANESVSDEAVVVIPHDGLSSAGTTFTVTPSINSTTPNYENIVNYYNGGVKSWTYSVRNIAPDLTVTPGYTTAAAPKIVQQNVATAFGWVVKDVDDDVLTVTWNFGDNTPDVVLNNAAKNGVQAHTFSGVGSFTVTCIVRDKDGLLSEIKYIYIDVLSGKTVKVTPLGPSSASYNFAGTGDGGLTYPDTLGAGMIKAEENTGLKILDNNYLANYGSVVPQALLRAIPYRVDSAEDSATVGVTNWIDSTVNSYQVIPFKWDSFFYAWKSENGAFSEGTLATKPHGTSVATLEMPDNVTNTTTVVATAVFSREYLTSDFSGRDPALGANVNLGDINLDGVPDIFAMKADLSKVGLVGISRAQAASQLSGTSGGGSAAGGASGGASSAAGGDAEMDYIAGVDLGIFNSDVSTNGTPMGDFLPMVWNDSHFVPNVSNVLAAAGYPFTGILEIRGFDDHLNYERDVDGNPLDPDFPLDEPGATKNKKGGTNPVLADTDGDGLPDGWEYYFWWFYGHSEEESGLSKHPAGLHGYAYCPTNIAIGVEIPREDVLAWFDPLTPDASILSASAPRDADRDGLMDLEELTLGTNPLHWDSDGDGMCDKFEVEFGLNPCSGSDANQNPDGDFMAYAVVDRMMVPFVNGEVTKNLISDGNGRYWTYYRYGNDALPIEDAPLAQGRLVSSAEIEENYGVADEGSSTSVKAVLLHFQVYQEFGFDPRVAWMDAVTGANTELSKSKPFTSKDEYLLAKFMAEVCNKPGFAIAAKGLGEYTTNPLTPDTDATSKGQDGMPDGWELYVMPNFNDMLRSYHTINPLSAQILSGYLLPKLTITPWNWSDGSTIASAYDVDTDGDGLSNAREFGGTISSSMYTNAAMYATALTDGEHAAMVNVITLTRPATDAGWLNKFWATDPWGKDTDGDGVGDADEKGEGITVVMSTAQGRSSFGSTFLYASNAVYNAADRGVIDCYRGCGLNPCSMDSDRDGIPDTWEYEFAGTNAVSPITGNKYVDGGMDGTHGPANGYDKYSRIAFGDAYSWHDDWVNGENSSVRREMDWDNDGLENYQEYWTQAIRGFRYDISPEDLPMDMAGNDPEYFFSEIENDWDIAYWSFYDFKKREKVMLIPEGYISYPSSDPRDPDTDGDGMDDFYEIYHGLNPLLGDVDIVSLATEGIMTYDANPFGGSPLAPLPMDFVKYPWMAGLPTADADADGLLNFEECILGYAAGGSSAANTDPSPMWMTDGGSMQSFVNRFYTPRSMFFWDVDPDANPDYYLGYSVFSYEMNEGYDTDNDGISDKNELILTSTSQSEPQDSDDPVRRQALWFDGEKSVAESLPATFKKPYILRSFTVEMWVCPEDVARDQVFAERPVVYPASDASTDGPRVRVNFRLGIKGDGRLYAMYQNAGGHDAETGEMIVYGPALKVGEWIHVAATMDGSSFTLYVNGASYDAVDTKLMPANGVFSQTINADVGGRQTADPDIVTDTDVGGGDKFSSVGASIVLGAQDKSTEPIALAFGTIWETYDQFFHGYLDEVRIWDGARTKLQIHDSYKTRFVKSDLLANRAEIAEKEELGWSRYEGDTQLPAELLYHYTFDNLFSADVASSVATAPRGFMADEVTVNRPEGYTVGWWNAWATKSLIYTNYGYVPWIENLVEHLPEADGTVKDSRYWSKTYSGKVPTASWMHGMSEYTFHSANNPYGLTYRNDMTDGLSHRLAQLESTNPASFTLATMKAGNKKLESTSDLLPLGNAWAKFCTNMWDNGSAGSVWAETGEDSDSDGLPDWWEMYKYGNLDKSWGDIDPDNPSQTVGAAYMRDLAKGYTETNHPGADGYDASKLIPQTSDIDQDGLPDWWENLYNLDSNDATANNGAAGDPDGDGLSNYAEYLVSEHYHDLYPSVFPVISPKKAKSSSTQTETDYYQRIGSNSIYLGLMFADHDMIEDAWEDLFNLESISRYVYDANKDPDDDGWSNWAESRAGLSSRRTNPTLVYSMLGMDGASLNVPEYPIPTIKTKIQYRGALNGPIVIWGYSNRAMDGKPDARFTIPNDSTVVSKTKYVGYWSGSVLRGYLSPGSVIPGSVELSFTDAISNNGKISTGVVGVDKQTTSAQGILYRGDEGVPQEKYPLGIVDYNTGAYEWDLSQYTGLIYENSVSNGLADGSSASLLEIPSNSYVTVTYSAQGPKAFTFPQTVYLTDADEPTTEAPSSGHLREGMNYFFAFMDVSGDGIWQPGEPFGCAEPFGVRLGWDLNEVDIELTDYQPGYLRFSATSLQRPEDLFKSELASGAEGDEGAGAGAGGEDSKEGTVQGESYFRIFRISANGWTTYGRKTPILEGFLSSPRTALTEADFLGSGQPALDWGLPGVTSILTTNVVYAIYIGEGEITTNIPPSYVFTNTFDYVQATPVAVSPVDSYVYSQRPVFRWTMPDRYPAFAIRIYNSAGRVVYDSGVQQRPLRTADGVCEWEAPIYANDYVPSTGYTFSSNQTYTWKVLPMDARFSSENGTWSIAKRFRLDVNAPRQSGGFGGIKACVKYYGPATNSLSNRVRLQVFKNAAFAGVPCGEYTLSRQELNSMTDTSKGNVNARVYGLAPNTGNTHYYVMAFIDHNENGVRDAWESWGYANYSELTDKPYDARSVDVDGSANLTTVEIRIEDADTDQDWFPDAWEFEQYPSSADFLSLIGSSVAPSTSTFNDAEVNWTLSPDGATIRSAMSVGAFLTLSSSSVGDSNGDGIDDRLALLTGLSASAPKKTDDGYSAAAKINLGLAPLDNLTVSLTGLNLTGLSWQVTVNRSASVSAASRDLLGATATSCTYIVQYRASLDATTTWTEVARGTVLLGGVQSVTDEVQRKVDENPDAGFFRVILVKE